VYDSIAGRFLERDPVAQIERPDVYDLATDNPINLVDSFGLWPFAWATFNIHDPYVVESQGEWLHGIIGKLRVSIYDVDVQACKYKVEIAITSDVPAQLGLDKQKWSAGVNIRTEYFLRQLYEKQGARLTPRYSNNLIKDEETAFVKQTWKMPKLENIDDLRKNIIASDKSGSVAMLRAVFRMSDKGKGEGWAVVSMTGVELGAAEGARPEPLTKEYPMRELNMKWAFDVKRNWAVIDFVQPGKPVWTFR
jgi:hypothetical protein